MSSATYKEAAAPGTPPSGYVVFYAKTDGLLYMKDDTGAEVPIKPIGGGTGDLLSDGSVPLVADWDVGAFKITAEQIASDIADGTAPFIVVSLTQVDNLMAEFASLADALHTNVRNSSGGILTKGTPVFISGYHVGSETIEVDLADANVVAEMPCIGLVSADIANNANGTVLIVGMISGIDTSAWSIGDKLWVSNTAGVLANTQPTGVTWIQKIGSVLRVHATLGIINISGANRTNELPQLLLDNMWIGDANGVPQESTATQIRTLLGVEAGADVTDATNVAAAGAVMDADISEGEGFMRKTGAGAYEAIKSNLAAAVAPAVTDDSDSDYAIGSLWLDTTADKAYVCLDVSIGAAVWTEITQSGSGAVVTTKGDIFGYDTTNKRIPIGANDEVLTADSTVALGLKWAAPAGGGGGQTVKHKSANYTAVAGEIIYCDSVGGAFIITLPASPSGDDRVTIVDSSGSAGTNNITVARNGETILGATEDFVIDQNFGKADFSYEGTGTDWKHALSGLS